MIEPERDRDWERSEAAEAVKQCVDYCDFIPLCSQGKLMPKPYTNIYKNLDSDKLCIATKISLKNDLNPHVGKVYRKKVPCNYHSISVD